MASSSDKEKAELSIVAQYDELKRKMDAILHDTIDEEFLWFTQQAHNCLEMWGVSQQNEVRLQRELDSALKNMSDLESKLNHARKLLEIESKARKEAEHDREVLEQRMAQVCDLLQTDRSVNEEMKSKLNFLKQMPPRRKRRSAMVRCQEEHDINSTGSFLSDLSLTQSEDDFLDANSRTHNKSWKRHRPSLNMSLPQKKNKSGRRSSTHKIIEISGNEKIIASTKVSVPQDDGPILAESKIEAIPSNNSDKYKTPMKETRSSKEGRSSKETPASHTFPTKPSTLKQTQSLTTEKRPSKETLFAKPSFDSAVAATARENNNGGTLYRTPMKTPAKRSNPSAVKQTPSAPPLSEVNENNFQTPQTVKRRPGRRHEFLSRTFFRPEMCTHCQKRIRFGNVGYKCKDCNVYCHTECADKLDIVCVPQSAGTPQHKGIGTLADFVTPYKPMIPSLLVHCVDEIEKRGFNEVGLYRVSGAEREVKGLKEKFLRGKGVPCLTNIDVHVICGCVKDFLRTLQEKLIPASMWTDFSNAVQSTEPENIERELKKAVEKLPEAHQDTLAFIMQHLQRVAEQPDIKMPLNNLAKVFAPTLIGSADVSHDQHKMYAEAIIQVSIMENLLRLPMSYWNKFTSIGGFQGVAPMEVPTKDTDFLSTPLYRSGKKDRKYYATPPYARNKH